MSDSEKNPTFQTLTRCFERGAALFTPFQFPGCDLIIPVFVPSTNEYTFIIVQVKNRRDDSVTNSLRNESTWSLLKAFKILKGIFGSSLPHIAIMMCLRCKREREESVLILPKRSGAGPETRAAKRERSDYTSGGTLPTSDVQGVETQAAKRRRSEYTSEDSDESDIETEDISRSSSAIRPISYSWEKTPRIVLLCVGFNSSLYPAIGVCGQKANNNTERIREHLTSVLDCIPEESIPSGLHSDYYKGLFPLEEQ